MTRRTLVIVNPQSANGATGRRWKQLEPLVRDALGEVEIEPTRGPRDAERLAREAARAGVERIVVAGGDGTLSEAASGLLAADLGDYAELGLLPLGTGGDFARGLAIPTEIGAALAALRDGKARRIDAGRVSFCGLAGEPRTSYFLNVSSFGISGLVDEIVNRTTKRLGGTVSFLIGTIRAILDYRSERVAIRVDGELVYDAPLVLATTANGRFFGGGMQIAPTAELDDGLLDVVIIGDFGVAKLLTKLPMLYRGSHLDDPGAVLHRGRVIEADAPAGRVLLELDGEPLGCLPIRTEVLPGALSIVGPSS